MIKVLVVDDSAFMRRLFTNTINEDKELKVIDTARNGKKALEKIKELQPDVITLDVEMPVKDGIKTLKKIAESENPVPVIMVSALDNRDTVIEALDLGAFDFIPKPSGSISLNIDDIKDQLLKKIKTAARCRDQKICKKTKSTPKIKQIKQSPKYFSKKDYPVIAIGCSSGGPRALKELLIALPGNLPAALTVVQHMPPGFTTSLASRINQEAAINVREAKEEDKLTPGLALIAPGDYHMEINDNGRVKLNQKPAKWGVRPSVDYMLNSLAKIYQDNLIGVILTGMGHDGAEGMTKLKKHNGYGIVEDKSTALVYGMPSATIEAGAYDIILPLPQIPAKIIEILERRS